MRARTWLLAVLRAAPAALLAAPSAVAPPQTAPCEHPGPTAWERVHPRRSEGPGELLRVGLTTAALDLELVLWPLSVDPETVGGTRTFVGRAVGFEDSEVIAARIDGELVARIDFANGAPPHQLVPERLLDPRAPAGAHALFTDLDVIGDALPCGSAAVPGGQAGGDAAARSPSTDLRLVRITWDVDQSFVDDVGGQDSARAWVELYTLVCSSLMERNLGVRVELAGIVWHLGAQAYAGGDDIWLQIERAWLHAPDLGRHDVIGVLFGPSLPNGTGFGGYANGLVCGDVGHPIGMRRWFWMQSSLQLPFRGGLLAAHELGHTLHLVHCDPTSWCPDGCDPGALMNPSPAGPDVTCTTNLRRGRIASAKACLEDAPAAASRVLLESAEPDVLQPLHGSHLLVRGRDLWRADRIVLQGLQPIPVWGTNPFVSLLDEDTLRIQQVPPLPWLGDLELRVEDILGNLSEPLTLTIVEQSPPRVLAQPAGTAGETLSWWLAGRVGEPFLLIANAQPDWLAPCETRGVQGFEILAGASVLTRGVLDPHGMAGFGVQAPPAWANTAVYVQLLLLDPSSPGTIAEASEPCEAVTFLFGGGAPGRPR